MEQYKEPLIQKQANWRRQYSFLALFYSNVFFCCIIFSIVTPALWLYIQFKGGNEYMLATTLLSYSLGELIGALAFGYMHNYCSTLSTFLSCKFAGTIGSVLFYMAYYIEDSNLAIWFIVLGRLFHGFWTGGEQAVQTSYISEVVQDKHKLKMLLEIGIAVIIGFLCGPLLGMLLNLLNFSVLGIDFNQYTWPPLLVLLLNISLLISFKLFLKEIPQNERPGRLAETTKNNIQKPDGIGVAITLFIFFAVFNSFAVQETTATPLVTDKIGKYSYSFGWDMNGAYLLFAGSSLLCIIGFVIAHFTSDRVDNRIYTMFLFGLSVIGFIISIDFEHKFVVVPLYLIGYFVTNTVFNMCRNICFTMMSRIVGPYKAGAYMGWMLAVGGVARMIGPYWAVVTLEYSIKLCFGITALLLCLGMLVLGIWWKHCDAHPYTRQMELAAVKISNQPDKFQYKIAILFVLISYTHKMARRKYQDEWGEILRRQQEEAQYQEQLRKQQEQQDRNSYKQALDFQLSLRQQQNQQMQRQRQLEGEQLNQRVQMFESERKAEMEYQKQLKDHLANEYTSTSENKKKSELDERHNKLMEDQKVLDRLRAQTEAENKMRIQQRQYLSQEEQAMREYRQELEFKRKQDEINEKLADLQRAYQAMAEVDRKEAEYRAYYNRVNQRQMEHVKNHSRNVTDQAMSHDRQISQWIDNNERSYKEKLAEKEELERQMRIANLQNTNLTLRKQMEDRHAKLMQELNEKAMTSEEMQRKVQAFREYEDAATRERRQNQLLYRQQLELQQQLANEQRASEFRLSETEKRLNRNILERNPLRSGANAILGGQSPTYGSKAELDFQPSSRQPDYSPPSRPQNEYEPPSRPQNEFKPPSRPLNEYQPPSRPQYDYQQQPHPYIDTSPSRNSSQPVPYRDQGYPGTVRNASGGYSPGTHNTITNPIGYQADSLANKPFNKRRFDEWGPSNIRFR